jgi:KDO2-lipid IV(A) lauroyltransferase
MEFIEYLPLLLLSRIARRLSFQTAGRIGAFLGRLAFHLPLSRKGVALDNLARALPDLPSADRRRIALGSFENYGITLMEFLWSNGRTREELLEIAQLVNPGVAEQYLKPGKTLILLSGHIGGWEMIIQTLRHHLGRPFAAIVHRQRNRRVDRLVSGIRAQFGDYVIPMGVAVRQVMTAIREGHIVVLLGDQSGPKESMFVDFFGRPAATHRGAAAFALRTGTPLVMVFMLRRPDGRYDAQFEEVDRTGIESYSEEHIDELTRRHTRILERHIRERPDLWLWMHKRWKHTEYYESRRVLQEAH